MRGKIAIVDCGTGNLASVSNAFKILGAEARVTSKPEDIRQAGGIVLPGVGAFGYFMERLRGKNLEGPLMEAIGAGKPYLGICLGMQVLFGNSEESPGVPGLGIVKGKVVKFRGRKVPQVGWNTVTPSKKGFVRQGYAYFVNSYYCVPEKTRFIAAESDYWSRFCCAVQEENILGVQFHPERSGEYGLELIGRWLNAGKKDNPVP